MPWIALKVISEAEIRLVLYPKLRLLKKKALQLRFELFVSY